MAQRVSRTRPGRGGPGSGTTRAAKATSRKPASTEVEVVEEEGGGDIDSGIVIITTVILVVAFFLVDGIRGVYGEGLFG